MIGVSMIIKVTLSEYGCRWNNMYHNLKVLPQL